MPDNPVVVDVRADLRQGRQPLSRILQTLKLMAQGQDMLLLTTFEPVPLYRVMALRGFGHEARRLANGDWEVHFRRRAGGPRPGRAEPIPGGRDAPAGTAVPPGPEATAWRQLDNRGLEPPEPMVRTFHALGELPRGNVLEIHNDRRPLFLYPHLQERSYRWQTLDLPDGSALVRIWRDAESDAAAEP